MTQVAIEHDPMKHAEKLPQQVRDLNIELERANNETVSRFRDLAARLQDMALDGLLDKRHEELWTALNWLGESVTQSNDTAKQLYVAMWSEDMNRQMIANGGSIRVFDPADLAAITKEHVEVWNL